MLSNQILQRTIHEFGRILHCHCSVWSVDGGMLAATGELDHQLREAGKIVRREHISYGGTSEWIQENLAFFLICDEREPVYFLALAYPEEPVDLKIAGRLCASQMEGLLRMGKERMDKNKFMQNLILDNLLLVDIYNQAKKLGISVEKKRAVILVEPVDPDDSIVLDVVKSIYVAGSGDYVTAVDERHVILIKALEETEDHRSVGRVCAMLVDTINAEAMLNVRVSYGTVIEELKDVSQSYKEAAMALDVGRIFYPEKNIFSYRELGIGRLIHQLPVSLCEMFLEEVFSGQAVSQFDEETLSTVDKFFENNLNISETARQLFVHRNTLVYRLEKIQKQTGLDVRVFEDALTFKIALMVADHLKYVRVDAGDSQL